MLLSRFQSLLDLQVLVHFGSPLFSILVQLDAQLLDFGTNEYAATLRTRLWLADVEHDRVLLGLGFSHESVIYLFTSLLLFALRVLLYVVELGWINPCRREVREMVGELFLETIQMDAEGALAANVVHAQKVICTLPVCETAEELRRHSTVGPKYVPVVRITKEAAMIS